VLFSSPTFLFVFLPILLGLYFVVRTDVRNLILLAASVLFYCWGEGGYVLVLGFSIVFNYLAGLCLGRLSRPLASKIVLALAVAGNLALLVAFKYANFLVDNLGPLLLWTGLRHHPVALAPVHLPLGVSFFTFQAISYVVDVYRREVPAQKNPLLFALYKTFFPQLIAGPIVRYKDVAKELAGRCVTLEGFAAGAKRFAVGLSKKMLVANTLAAAADAVFGIPAGHVGPAAAWLGIICYTFQIYFDFSGYSDMAIGLGRMFGFHFPENFRHPYAAASVTDFWRRWHMSLSGWFRDYLYVPLGGNRCGRARLYFNLLIVFALCGFWHGASWNFLLWGLFHGALLTAERMGLAKAVERLWRPLRHVFTMAAVLAGWVLFRTATPTDAALFFRALAGFSTAGAADSAVNVFWNMQVALALVIAVIGSAPVWPLAAQGWGRLRRWAEAAGSAAAVFVESTGALVEGTTCLALLVLSTGPLAAGTYNPFIYFRF